MNNLRNRYAYYERTSEREFWIVWIATHRFLRFIYRTKRTIFLAGLFLLTNLFKVTFEFGRLLLVEPTLYRIAEPNQAAEEIEGAKNNNWRVI